MLPCQKEKLHFKTSEAKNIWIKFHKKRCELCRTATSCKTTTSNKGSPADMNKLMGNKSHYGEDRINQICETFYYLK
jgi:hypothetical protein